MRTSRKILIGEGNAIIIALIWLFAGAHAALARQLHSHCEAANTHRHGATLRMCHWHPKYDFQRAPLAGFETEWDVEKWEKALRDGASSSRIPP
jgi:hypothetical protein